MIENIIKKYALAPHPEGGYFKEIYRSKTTVLPGDTFSRRKSITHIYFLLSRNQISRFHKVTADEIWHFYEGAPIRLIQFDGKNIRENTFGNPESGYVDVVESGIYQAAESTGDYSLVGCSVAPGFEFDDFSFLADAEEMAGRLVETYPEYRRFI